MQYIQLEIKDLKPFHIDHLVLQPCEADSADSIALFCLLAIRGAERRGVTYL